MAQLDINGSINGDSDALETIGNLDNDLDNVVSRLERLHEQGLTVQFQVNENQLGDGSDGDALVAKIQDA